MQTGVHLHHVAAVTEAEICGDMVQMYAGLRENELRFAAIKYFDNVVRGREFAEIKALVSSLRQTGTELWAVSSTNKWSFQKVFAILGFPLKRAWLQKSL